MPITRFAATAIAAALLASTAAHAAEPEFSPDRLRAHVTFLADDLLEGREAGTRGHELAAGYIATQFALAGAKPGGDNGTWQQRVGLLETALTGPAPTASVTGPGGARTFTNGVEVVIRGPTTAGSADVTGQAVFAGFGMVDKPLGLDDYKGLDVRGKIVVLLRGAPLGMDSEAGAHLLSDQARFAAERGAIGLVYVQSASAARAQPWAQATPYATVPRVTYMLKDGKPFDGVYGLKAVATFGPDAAPTLFAGAPRTLEQVRAQDAVKSRPRGFPLKVTVNLKAATANRSFTSPNVVGVIEGSDPALKDEYVVIMGHADHLGIKPAMAGDNIYNGAMDNATGIATLIEVAQAFSKGDRPRRSVLLLAVTAEEKGLLGAEAFARSPTVPADKIVGAVNLDMPILTYDFRDVVAYGGDHSTLAEYIRRAGATLGVTLSPDPQPEQTIFVRSDHYALVKAGIPSVFLSTGRANGGTEGWATFLSTHYHQPSDDLKQPINWAASARFAQINYLVARDIANADQAPRWYANDYFGDLFAPNAPKAPKPAR